MKLSLVIGLSALLMSSAVTAEEFRWESGTIRIVNPRPGRILIEYCDKWGGCDFHWPCSDFNEYSGEKGGYDQDMMPEEIDELFFWCMNNDLGKDEM